ncbi:AAA family ATPase [Serinibacter arcticus]|uniref:AAA family ATPase n=1 Tax=Serinibacter arcticus TaxID=1655435 RepID=A0A2U1ZXA0_9MICO|nr:AAA family ATPase [Serinibacter arcticus]PWD51615.1 AAA family ATPase [Serinibacter arcticus]
MTTQPPAGAQPPATVRQSAEERWADELVALDAWDAARGNAVPPGWRRSPRAVRAFVVGAPDLGVSRKYLGNDPLVDRAIVTLLGRQGLMLVGDPGTAKSMLSELLAAAISGTSNLTIQGTAGTTEDHIRYSWNYSLLLAEGPTARALVPSPIHSGLATGRVVRFEELTRCAPEIQDVLVSVLSEKALMVPEMGADVRVSAAPGFNLIATANLRDRGVNEMSAALKRRFNFETVHPIADRQQEIEVIERQVAVEIGEAAPPPSRDVIDLLVTAFRELRTGRTEQGVAIVAPETVMSTAEAVNVAVSSVMEARYFGDGRVTPTHLARQLTGVALKDSAEDRTRLRAYLDSVVRDRARRSPAWQEFHTAARDIW